MQIQLLPVDSRGFVNYDYVMEQVTRNNPTFTFTKLTSAVYADPDGDVTAASSTPTGGL